MLNAAEIAELRAAIEELVAIPPSYDRDGGRGGFLNRCINNALSRVPPFLSYVDRAGLVEIAETIHVNDCPIIGLTIWITGLGGADQQLHANWQPLTVPAEVMSKPEVKIPIYICIAYFFLGYLDEEIGPAPFILGSHRGGRAPKGDIDS